MYVFSDSAALMGEGLSILNDVDVDAVDVIYYHADDPYAVTYIVTFGCGWLRGLMHQYTLHITRTTTRIDVLYVHTVTFGRGYKSHPRRSFT